MNARLLSIPLALGLASCDAASEDADPEFRIAFDVRANGDSFRCGQSYDGIGTANTTVEPLDIRLYIHDVHLVTGAGEEVPLALTPDQTWQRDGVALLDFADDTGRCATGNPELNTEIVGTAPVADEVVGLRFTLGLPTEANHIDAVRSPAPFNAPGMWWSWTGGFKYARIDVATPTHPAWFLHLGATSCEGSPADGIECAWDNVPQVELAGMNPLTETVVLDIASLYSGSDLDAQIDYESDFINGCMAFSGDPECAPIFERLGVEFEGTNTFEQRAFTAEP